MEPPVHHAVIVGGGIAGLSAAHALAAADPSLKIALVESGRRLGGKIRTDRENGFVIEGGPDSFISYKPWAMELCRKLGLADRLTGTNPDPTTTYILHRGRMMRLPEGLMLLAPTRLIPFAMSPLFSIPGKLRMAMDLVLPKREDPSDESLANFVRRRLGREAVDRLAGPLLAGIYAGAPERMSLLATFPQFAEVEKKYGSLILGMVARRREAAARKPSPYTMFMTLRGGLGEMVEALERQLHAVRMIRGRAVTGLSPRESGGYDVVLEGGETISARSVILAAPAYAAGDLLRGFSPELSRELHAIRYVSTATVSLAYPKKGLSHPLNGFGFVVAGRESSRIMACTWTSTKFPHRAPGDHALIRCFIGGEGREEVTEGTDEAIVRSVRDDLRSMLGIDSEPELAKLYRWTKANPQYDVGHLDRVRIIEEGLSRHPGIFIAGAAYHGVGVPDCVRSGTRAAEGAMDYLKSRS
jgi:oxygen-dependent protoporphyrinogen oxidase